MLSFEKGDLYEYYKTTTSEEIFPYIAFVPEELGEKPAVIFQLHGAGERGDGGMPWNADVLDMPIWAFHGLEDKTVDPINTIHMIERLKDRPNVRCDLYEGVGHNSWGKAFSEELLGWMLSKSR